MSLRVSKSKSVVGKSNLLNDLRVGGGGGLWRFFPPPMVLIFECVNKQTINLNIYTFYAVDIFSFAGISLEFLSS